MSWKIPLALVFAAALAGLALCVHGRSDAPLLSANAAAKAAAALQAPDQPALNAPGKPVSGCLPSGDGFFRARLDGDLQMRLDWSDAQLTCEGMPRPGGDGIRLSFRRQTSGGTPFLVVLGIAGLSESSSGRALPANITIIEGTQPRVYGTLGDDKCTVDELRQELLSQWQPRQRVYRVSGRGFCMEPALAVGGERRVLISTFDFAGQVMYEDVAAARRPEGPV